MQEGREGGAGLLLRAAAARAWTTSEARAARADDDGAPERQGALVSRLPPCLFHALPPSRDLQFHMDDTLAQPS